MPGEFKINISGQKKAAGAFDKLVNQLKPKVAIFSPGYEINIYSFAQLNYRIEISGVPSRFDYIDNLVKSMKMYLDQYLINWEYSVQVKYIESG